MSTDQSPKHRSVNPEHGPDDGHKLDLSPAKIVGGALAAMTAAALGAQLSVAGTVIGAAVASVIAAVAGSLYTASLARTGGRIRRVWRPVDSAPASTGGPEVLTTAPDASLTSTAPAARRRLSWSSVLVGAVAAFGLAAAALTGIELISGQALSGGDGTTVSQVSRPNDPSPTSTPESATPEASPTDDDTPTRPTTSPPTAPAEPSAVEPSATPSAPIPTEEPTAPSTSPEPSASETVTPGP